MRPNFPKPALPPASLTPAVSRSPGQHEEIIDRVQNGFERTLDLLDQVIKQRQDMHVIVQVDMSIQHEILAVVKEILEVVSNPPTPVPDPNTATTEEIKSILGPPVERLQGVGGDESNFGGKKKKRK